MSHRSFGLLFASSLALLVLTGPLAGCSDDETTAGTAGNGGMGATGGNTGGVGGTGAAGGNTGGGGIINSGADTCPGDPQVVTVGDMLVLQGDTSMANGDYESFCGNEAPGSGPDLVYAIQLADPATVSYTLTSDGALDPVMYVRTSCEDATSNQWCRDFSATTRENKRHVEAGTHYVFVDGNAGKSGKYTLTLETSVPACGDGVVIPGGEACDDGNTVSGDGCSADCSTVEPGSSDECAAADEEFIGPGETVLSGSTLGNTNNHIHDPSACAYGDNPPGSAPADSGGPDRVYHLRPTVDGNLTLRLGFNASGDTADCVEDFNGPRCWDRVLSVRHSPGALGPSICQAGEDISDPDPLNWVVPNNQIACSIYGKDPDYTQAVTIPVFNGESYYVFVGGYYGGAQYNQGPYDLHVELSQ